MDNISYDRMRVLLVRWLESHPAPDDPFLYFSGVTHTPRSLITEVQKMTAIGVDYVNGMFESTRDGGSPFEMIERDIANNLRGQVGPSVASLFATPLKQKRSEMIFNTEDEIRAHYRGRMDEADRWAWWQGGVKWCGRSDVRSLQDVLAELTLQMAQVIELFRRESVQRIVEITTPESEKV